MGLERLLCIFIALVWRAYHMQRSYAFLGVIQVLFVSVLLISNIAASKMTSFLGFTFDGGTLLFPLSYIFGDILTEVYGYKQSRSVIWLGFVAALGMALLLYVVGLLPPAPDWSNQAAYEAILGVTPRIVCASVIAYVCGEFMNSFILAKMKIATGGKWLWTRTIGSTIVGELVDSALFVTIAFAGLFPFGVLITIILSNYIFKTLVEVAFTPLTYAIIGFLKKKEHEDYFDYGTDFNPLPHLK